MPRSAPRYLPFALATACHLATAAPGDLDTSFGTAGKVLTQIGAAQNDRARAIAIDAAGNLYVAGGTDSASSRDFGVLRLLPDGQPDASFGSGGKVVVDVGANTKDLATSIALDAQGRILVAGVANPDGRNQFAAIRLLHKGDLDGGYGDAGRALVDNPTPANDNCNGIALAADGSLYLAGSSFPSGMQALKIAQLTAAGNAGGFGGFGYVAASPAHSLSSTAVAAMPDRSGDLYVAATLTAAQSSRIALVKYDATGRVDDTFHDEGASYAGAGLATSMARDADGHFFIAGIVTAGGANGIGIAKFDVAGALVDGFGTHGLAAIALPGATIAGTEDVQIDADGNLYVTAPAYVFDSGSMTVVAHVDGTSGAPIASFGSNGIATVDMGDAAYGGSAGVVDAARRRFCFASARQDSAQPALFAVGCVQTAATNAIFRSGFE